LIDADVRRIDDGINDRPGLDPNDRATADCHRVVNVQGLAQGVPEFSTLLCAIDSANHNMLKLRIMSKNFSKLHDDGTRDECLHGPADSQVKDDLGIRQRRL
jgi:hypothetical protein